VTFGYEGWNVSNRDWALNAEGDNFSLTAYGLADTPGCAMWHNKIQIECSGEDGYSSVVSLFADKNSID